ncbi:MAG: LamG-like jellyroll fold domain-containing protein [Polyangiaceae bacterium]|nr:LamG-like jellyroll fold domain-containing protein [Polyangiaceae bacterium]
MTLFSSYMRTSVPLLALLAVGCSLLAPTDAELLGGFPPQSGGTTGLGGANPSGGSGGFAGGASGSGTGGILGAGGIGGNIVPAPMQPAQTALSVWLKADSGLSTTDNQVTAWASPAIEQFPAYAVGQSVDAQQPVLGSALLGGRSIPVFDGADDFLSNSEDHDFTSQSGFAFFIVLVPGASDGSGEILSIDGANGYRLGLWQRDTALEFGSTNPASPNLLTQNAFLTEDPVMIEVIGTRPSGGEAIVSTFINGVPIAGGAAPTWDYETEVALTLGGHDADSPHFTGSIAEVLIYNEPLDGAARFGTEKYLMAKWGCCGR